jgi:peptidoglycan/xylan/chitin deacetylase (PgdA/CDA1 family)
VTADRTGAPLILMYHSVGPRGDDPYQVTVSPGRFARQMDLLARLGVTGCSVGELLRRDRPRGRIGLSFDDGFGDFVTEAMPVLRRYGFTASVYVLPGRLGGDNGWEETGPSKPLMTAAQVLQAAAAGMEVGSHGLRHRHLPPLGPGELEAEVAGSRSALEDLLGTPVAGFCYPYGECGEREASAVAAAGYDHACAVRPSRLPHRYALPRAYVGERDGAARLLAKWVRHRALVRAASR